MKKHRYHLLLMILAILGVAGFQAFWLKQTYDREKQSLAIKTDFAFRTVVQNLQVAKLKLDSTLPELPGKPKVKMIVTDTVDSHFDIKLNGKRGMISTINVIQKKAGDTLSKNTIIRQGVFVSKDQQLFDRKLEFSGNGDPVPNRDHIFRFLYGVDSLQDSLKISEITQEMSKQLNKEKISVPFRVTRTGSVQEAPADKMNEVTVGFAHPVTYMFQTGNSIPYILKRISLPILFSILLLGITLLSFVLLYRNLLKQRRLTEIKNEFIGNITHELKTPISTVSVAIEAMKNFNVLQNPERTQEYLGIAGQELNRLSLLVDKVLRLAMFENREVELKYESFDFTVLLQDVVKSMQLQFEKSRADVTLEVSGADFFVEADRMHITSVLYNLLDNAVKYSKENPVITLTVISTGEEMIMKITDNGIGINPAYKARIFDKFFRVPQGNRHNVKGYGLGLSYAAHIMERHKGSITVESDGVHGAEFTIKFPRSNGN